MRMDEIKVKKGRPYPLGASLLGEDINIAAQVKNKNNSGIIIYSYDESASKYKEKRIPFDQTLFSGKVGSLCIMGESLSEGEVLYYNLYDGENIVLDPYAKQIAGRDSFGSEKNQTQQPLCAFRYCKDDSFDWEDDRMPQIPYEDSFIYLMHVRGFSRSKGSGVKAKGTFLGVAEKLEYLKDLGVRNIELMPAYDFDEWESLTSPADPLMVKDTNSYRLNFWGYKEASYFAPKASYSILGDPVREFKLLVKEAHKLGMEIIGQFYFPDKIREGYILDVLKYWVMEYHLDGFHLMGNRIPLTLLSTDPLLSGTKLLYYDFPYNEIYAPSERPDYVNLASANDEFLIFARKFLKGDENMLTEGMRRMTFIPDKQASIHYITNYYGFTLNDLVSYDRKHNEGNGEGNTDGNDMNYSWNCQVEGDSRKNAVRRLRRGQMRNALSLVFLSQGTPCIHSGDEDLNTQEGNNNPYCQDNKIGYKDWNKSKAANEMFAFVKGLADIRRAHPVLRKASPYVSVLNGKEGFPELSFHGEEAYALNCAPYNRHMGILYAGEYGNRKGEKDNDLFIAINMHWLSQTLSLPILHGDMEWVCILDTFEDEPFTESKVDSVQIKMPERSIRIYESRKITKAPKENGKTENAEIEVH